MDIWSQKLLFYLYKSIFDFVCIAPLFTPLDEDLSHKRDLASVATLQNQICVKHIHNI